MDKDYIQTRTEICSNCPICDVNKGICNSNLYLNPETNDVSTKPKSGYTKGCGCYLKRKIEQIKSKCPLGKW